MRSNERPTLERTPLRLLALVTVLALLGGVQARAATIHTDLWLYQKGDTVQVFGEDFGPAETVDVVTTSPTGAPVDAGTSETDAEGALTYAFVLDSDESGIFDVVATGRDSGLTATTQFDPAHATLSPTSSAFGNVNVGATSAPQTFTISNTGTTPLNVSNVALTGDAADQFALDTSGMSSSVAAGTSTTFTVAFAPTSAGAKSATLNVTTNAEDPTASLTGTGVATDTTPPSVSLSSTATEPTSVSPIPVTVTFSETVTGFVAGDVTISNGSASNFAGSGTSYTFDLVPAGAGTVTADVGAGVATDGAGNPNTVAAQFSRTYAPNTAPTISDVSDQTIAEDGTTGALAVTVGDAQTAAGSLTLTGSSSDTALVPNAYITFGGSGASRTVTVVPAADRSGSATITLEVSDGSLTATDTFTVTVTAVNDDPVCQDVAISTTEDTPGSTTPDCTDADGDTLTYTVSAASDGTSGSSAGEITYGPDANFYGSDGFTHTAEDGNGGSDTADVDVTVSAVNDAPSAADDSATTAQDATVSGIDVLGNDIDVDGDPLTVGAFDATSAEGGTVSCSSDCSYTPPAGFSGTDTFGYTVDDGNGGSDDATVTVTVSETAGTTPPTMIVLPAAQSVQYTDPIRRVAIFGDDAETPGSGLTFRASGMPEGVTFADGGGGRAFLQGVADDAPGVYPVRITVTDAGGASTSMNAVITITPEDVTVRYTGDHLVFTGPGSHGDEVHLSATVTDLAASEATHLEPVLRAATSGDETSGDVSNATVTFMKGETVLCGPVPVAVGDPTDPTLGTAACDVPVALPLGSHDVDVHVTGAYGFSARVGQVEIDRATRNYMAGGGFVTAFGSAGEVPAAAGSRVSFGFRVRFSPRLTNVRGHANVLFVSGGSTYQVRSHDIGSVDLGRGGSASFVTTAAFTDVTDPLHPVALGEGLRVQVWIVDGGSSPDRIAIAVYRGGTLAFASRWDGGPVKKNLGGGDIVVH